MIKKITGEILTFNSNSDFINYVMKNNEKLLINEEEYLNLYNFLTFYKSVKNKINNNINKFNEDILKEKNEIIKDVLNKFVYLNSGGKYLRGMLCALGYKAYKNDDDYLSLSTALEVFQTSILIHDDIIDKASKRRGKDTIPTQYIKKLPYTDKVNDFSNAMALCMGDLGFYLTNKVFFDNYKDNPNLINVLSYFNEVAIKTNKGEMLDVYLPYTEENYKHCDNLEEKIFEIYNLKTAWYTVSGPFCLGLRLAGVSDTKDIEDILVNIGVAFQVKDDLIGIYSKEKETGKTASDVMEYKQTILYSYTLNTSFKEELLKYYGTDNNLKVAEIFELSGAKKYAINKMNELFDKAILDIKQTSLPNSTKSILIGFTEFLRE